VRLLYLVHQYFPRHVGGTEVYTRGLVRRAVACGHRPAVLCYEESESLRAEDYGPLDRLHEGVPVRELVYNLARAPDVLGYEYDNPVVAKWVGEALDAQRPDLVHAMHAMKLSASALRACFDRDIPVVVTLTDFWFLCPRHTLLRWDGRTCSGPRHRSACVRCVADSHDVPRLGASRHLPESVFGALCELGLRRGRRHPRRFWPAIHALARRPEHLRQVLAQADRVVALSQRQRELFARNGFRGDMQVLDHGLEPDDGDAAPCPPREVPVVSFVGSLRPHKGAHVLVEALRRAPRLRIELRVYGSPGGRSDYADALRARSAGDPRIRWLGTFPSERLGAVLRDSDLLAFPALWFENNPLVVKAALRGGVPVMASRIGCLPDWIRPGANGWLVAPGSARAWAAALARAARGPLRPEPDPRVKGMDAHALEVFEIYEEVVAGHA
jgi:glycosyltransferase involved in cell wall biosynthesis